MKRRMFLGGMAASGLAPQAILAKAPDVAERPAPRAKPRLRARPLSIDDIVAKYNPSGQSAAILADLSTGETLGSYRSDLAVPPASVTKVVTTLYGLDRLGPDYAFVTRILIDGDVRAGALEGDLILAGGGDPTLDSDELAALVKDLKARGINRVNGRFYYFDQALPYIRQIDASQPVEAPYNPSVSGLNLNFNRVHLSWEGPDALALTARAEHHAPPVRSIGAYVAARGAPVYQLDHRGGAEQWSLAASAISGSGAAWLPVRSPGAYAAETFASLARQYGLALPTPERTERLPQGREAARFERRALRLVCRGMLHFSTNLTAEVIGLTASGEDSLKRSGQAMERWAKGRFGLIGPQFRDHSGLGDDNRVSPADMARILRRAQLEGALDGLLRRYYVHQSEGAEIRAKTGTLNYVRGLAGTIAGKRGQRLVFAIFSSDLEARSKIDRTLTRQPGARRYGKRAHALEQAVLQRWIEAFAL